MTYLSLMAMLLLSLGGLGLPLGIPPGEEDPLLSRIAPEKCLVYLSWAGVAKADPKSDFSTERLIADPEVQFLLSEFDKAIESAFSRLAEEGSGAEERLVMVQSMKLGKKLAMRPTAMFLESMDVGPSGLMPQGALVSHLGDEAPLFSALVRQLAGEAEKVTIGGVEMLQFKPDPSAPVFTVGFAEEYLYVGIGEGAVEGVFERAKGKEPAWLSRVKERLSVPRRSMVFYGDVTRWLALIDSLAPAGPRGGPQQVFSALGVSNVRTVSGVCGLDQEGFVSRTFVEIEGEPQGILAIVEDRPLARQDLEAIPGDVIFALAARISAERMLDELIESIGKVDPAAGDRAPAEMAEAAREMGLDSIRGDLLEPLGDVWRVYLSPGEGGLLTGVAAVVDVDDRETLAATKDKLVEKFLASFGGGGGFGRPVPEVSKFEFEGQTIEFLAVGPERGFPFAPAWCITENKLVVALYPQTIKAYLRRGEDFKSLADASELAGLYKDPIGPTILTWHDDRQIWDLAYGPLNILSHFALSALREEGMDISDAAIPSGRSIRRHLRAGVGTITRKMEGIEFTSRQSLPGVGAAPLLAVAAVFGMDMRGPGPAGDLFEALSFVLLPSKARELTSRNNLKQIALAMHNYHDVHGHLPPAYSTDEDGKPLLSWRVLILPYLDQTALYDSFHLDEPWDSEHNLVLAETVLSVYAAPGSEAEAGKTVYQAIRSEGSLFPGKDGIGFRSVTDGTSNTAMVVETTDERAVVWTKPDDYEPDEMSPARGLIGLRKGGFLAARGDGSVLKVPAGIDKENLTYFFTRNDGNAVYLEEEGGFSPRGGAEATRVDVRDIPADAKPEPAPRRE